MRDVIAEAVAGAGGPARALEEGLRSYFTFMREHGAAWTALVSEAAAASEAGEAIEQVRAQQVGFISDLMRLEVPQLEPDRAAAYAEVVVGATERLASIAQMRATDASSDNTGPAPSPAELAGIVMDVIWVGLDGLQRGKRWSSR